MNLNHLYITDNNKRIEKIKGHIWIGVGALVLLCGINITPLFAATPQLLPTPTKVPAKKAKQTPKPTSKPVKVKIFHSKCKGRVRSGHFCLGRVIGPQTFWKWIRCPHDGHSLRVKVLKKKWKARKYDSDFRPHMGRYKQSEHTWICQKCGYAAYPKDFFKPYSRSLMEHTLRRFRQFFKKGQKMPFAYRSRALQDSYWARKQSIVFFVDLLFYLSWVAREEKNKKWEKKLRPSIISGLKLALKKKLYPVQKRPRMTYLLAELYRQRGQFTSALRALERTFYWLRKNSHNQRSKEQVLQDKYIESLIFVMQAKIGKKNRKVYTLP